MTPLRPTAMTPFRSLPSPFPIRLLARLLAFLALAACLSPARAQHDGPDENGPGSSYLPFASLPFFVLADTQYGSRDEARVRLEVPARDGGRDMLEAYGGVDIVLYRVPRPLEFLHAQKNLHRIDVRARARDDEGLANTLAYLWDNAWKKSRFAWRDVFSAEARRTVTAAAPALRTHPDIHRPTDFVPARRFDPLEGFELVDRFRYPVWQARPIAPPAGVALQGSSSDFLPASEGNVHIPLGRRPPGLYLVEAIIGNHRAVTLVFVSDTVAISKIAAGELTVWTADRSDGRPVAGTRLRWTDGTGTLKSATTDARGLARLEHPSPERTYLLGEDTAGGVFVSENFYYDSEIHDTKLYAITDRPLYRPGDLVQFKLLARTFVAANRSQAAPSGDLDIAVHDPNGTPVLTARARFDSATGADTAFRLPENAVAGGYDVTVTYRGQQYGAAFRVAEYVKPHFEITLIPDQPGFKTGEPVAGRIRLSYPDGKPVANAAIELGLRAQTLTMVEGELRYSGLFPIQLATASLKSDAQGEARFTLPPASEPSRLILTLLATDGAAYRVRSTRELLVERAAASWRLRAERRFSRPGEPLRLTLEADGEHPSPPAQWEIVRLEDQRRENGRFEGGLSWTPVLTRPGSYSLMLRDAAGQLVAATAHWVSGEGLQVAPGAIEMVSDRESYRPGETADILISFTEPVDEALLTLERDRVEGATLLSAPDGWVKTERIAPNQWRARVPIEAAHAPNMTFSAVYVKDGDYVFQNVGLVVAPPKLELTIRPARDSVQPGETVEVEVQSLFEGQPVPAVLTVSVVDEMIYALQPEIAPSLNDFLQHIRRNNVRTGASLNFIAYDEALDYSADAARNPPARHQYGERGVKVLERPRRDDTDTALWLPTLKTDHEGRARFSFRMPDALSRWRITVRALGTGAQDGVPGQRTAHLRSDKPFYAKWTSPTWMREGDRPELALAVFNNGPQDESADVTLTLGHEATRQSVRLARGINYLHFPLSSRPEARMARVDIHARGERVDSLETVLQLRPARWRGPRERFFPLDALAATPLNLPAGASGLRLRLAASGAEHFLRVADALVDYPWGCTEQTASRLIPLALITPLLAPDRPVAGPYAHLWQALYSQRLRLAALAGMNGHFGWWGEQTRTDPLMTAYAYYADWYASRALGLDLPAGHWEQVLEVYREQADASPVLHRALALWFAQETGLPVRTQVEGLLEALRNARPEGPETDAPPSWSPVLAGPASALGLAHAQTLAAVLAQRNGLKTDAGFARRLEAAHQRLIASERPLARALLLLAGEGAASSAPAILATVSEDMPTLDRALTLVWTQKALQGELRPLPTLPPPEGWQVRPSALGSPTWFWPADRPLPQTLELGQTARQGGGLTAIVRFEAEDDPGPGSLPARLERRLYRLERTDQGYVRTLVRPEDGLSAQALYLDEIVLEADAVHERGLIEAPLPPGAAVEEGTWGVALFENGKAEPLGRSQAQNRPDGYGVPIDRLEGKAVVHHLLRVGQRGQFVIPPARYHQMYQPEHKALSDRGDNSRWVVN